MKIWDKIKIVFMLTNTTSILWPMDQGVFSTFKFHFVRNTFHKTVIVTPQVPPCPWDSPGENTGVGCHGLLRCVEGKREREVARSCSTLPDPVDRGLPGSSAHGSFQARGLEWVAVAFSGDPGSDPCFPNRRRLNPCDCVRLREYGDDGDDPNAPVSTVEPEGGCVLGMIPRCQLSTARTRPRAPCGRHVIR